jgi:DHA2 family multidrug resistance protein
LFFAANHSIEPGAYTVCVVSTKTWIPVLGSNLGAFMAVLKIQIVNASLADIQGAIGGYR